MYKKLLFLLVVCAILILSCAKPPKEEPNTSPLKLLDGTWVLNCMQIEYESNNLYVNQTITYNFKANLLTESYIFYQDQNCENEEGILIKVESSAVLNYKGLTSIEGMALPIYKVNVNFLEKNVTVYDEALKTSLENNSPNCTFIIGEKIDVLKCNGNEPKIVYNIFTIIDNNKFYPGEVCDINDPNDGSTDEKRLKCLSEIFYTKLE